MRTRQQMNYYDSVERLGVDPESDLKNRYSLKSKNSKGGTASFSQLNHVTKGSLCGCLFLTDKPHYKLIERTRTVYYLELIYLQRKISKENKL